MPTNVNPPTKLSLKLQKRSANLITYAMQVARAAQAAIWLGIFDEDDFRNATNLYYNSTSLYEIDEYNLLGLQAWERAVVERWFPANGRILVTGMGGGREVYGLAKLGFDVEGSEPNKKLAAHASEWLKRQGISARVYAPDASDFPEPNEPYDGVLVGWGSYLHIAGREQRITFLKKLRAVAKTGAPIIFSFYTREERAWQYRWVAWLANMIRKVRLGKTTVEVGDWVELPFEHYFTRSEIEAELREAGLRMAHFSMMDYGHAVGITDI